MSYSVIGPGGRTSSMRTDPPLKSATSTVLASCAIAAAIRSVSLPARLRTVDSRPSSGSLVVATTASGAKPSRRNASKPRSTHPPRDRVDGGGGRDRVVDPLQPRRHFRARAGRPEGQRHDGERADVGIGLDDRHESRPPVHQPVLVLVPAQHEIDPGHGGDELGVLLERQVRQRDDRVGLAAKLLHFRSRGLDAVAVAHPVLFRRVDRHADEADPDGPSVDGHRNDRRRRHAGERLAAGVGDVRRHEPELRLREVRAERRLRHVELVVAERRPVDAGGVQHVDHLPPRQRLPVHDRRSRAPTATGSRRPASSAAASAFAFNCWMTVATRASPPDFPPSTGRIS